MEVLFLAHRAPFPPDKGDRLRAWRHLGALARLGPVDLVAPADSEAEAEAARAGLRGVCREAHVVPRGRAGALLHMAAALAAGRPLTLGWLADGRVDALLADLLGRHRYDLVWAFSSGTAPWWRRTRGARTRIVDLCDLDALKWEALAAQRRGAKALVWRREARRLLPVELDLAREADLTLVSSGQEAADLLLRAAPRRLEVLTNGTDWRGLAGLPRPSTVGPVLGFLGQMDYPPNVEAALELARGILPRLPAARLLLIGRKPAPELVALHAPPRIEVTGEVASVAGALARVAIFVAPLDQGRGIPNKILEALAAGRATVISSWSARALSGRPGHDYLVADGVEARAQCAASLLADPARCDALGAAGQAYVRAHHDWDTLLARLLGWVAELAAGPVAEARRA